MSQTTKTRSQRILEKSEETKRKTEEVLNRLKGANNDGSTTEDKRSSE